MKNLIFLFLIVLTWGCSAPQSNPVPEHLLELENLTVYSSVVEPITTITFQKDGTYGDTDKVLIGRMGEIAADSLGRIFIADVASMVIHVFAPDGRLIGQLGKGGRGPGEFSSYIKNLQILNHHLYALDPGSHRLHVFNLNTLSSETTISLAGNRSSYRPLERSFPYIRNLFVRGDNTFIAEFVMNASDEKIQLYQNREMKGSYYQLDNNGFIQNELLHFTSEIRTNLGLIINLKDFFGHILRGFSSDDYIYLGKPDHFLIKTYKPSGDYRSAFFHPVRKIPITKRSVVEARVPDRRRVSGREISLMETVDLPETWPVLTDMKIDDQDRLWIATTVEDMSIYEWWVLEETGELITRFEWPRDEPIEVVKNGFMYTRQTDDETGLQQVVRYRIVTEEV
jgi:hypothetical protein